MTFKVIRPIVICSQWPRKDLLFRRQEETPQQTAPPTLPSAITPSVSYSSCIHAPLTRCEHVREQLACAYTQPTRATKSAVGCLYHYFLKASSDHGQWPNWGRVFY